MKIQTKPSTEEYSEGWDRVFGKRRMKTIYIAGCMRGIKWYNFPAFDQADLGLRALGWDPINPAQLDRDIGFDPMALPEDHDWSQVPPDFDFKACIDRDIEAVKKADAIYMLEGWRRSKGARAERALAEWLGKDILYYSNTPAYLKRAALLNNK